MATITAAVDVKTSTLDSRKEALRGRNPGGYGGGTTGTSLKRGDALAVDIDAHDTSMDIVTDNAGNSGGKLKNLLLVLSVSVSSERNSHRRSPYTLGHHLPTVGVYSATW